MTLKCDEGEPGIITWTPDDKTSDTVYYQCFTHRYLGWKINVLDSCDRETQASNRHEIFLDIETSPSIHHESKLLPNDNFLQRHEKDLIKHHNMSPDIKLLSEHMTEKDEKLHEQLTEGIKAAENFGGSISKQQSQILTNTKQYLPKSQSFQIFKNFTSPSKFPQTTNFKHLQRPPSLRRPQISGVHPVHRPPQNFKLPFVTPVKLPIRRPIAVERRPLSRQPNPYLLPQQSVMINQYKSYRPPVAIRNNNINMNQPTIMHQPAAVLMLGEPTEIKPSLKKSLNLIAGKPLDNQKELFSSNFKDKTKYELLRTGLYKNSDKKSIHTPKPHFKDPFNIKNESNSIALAANTGFKADTIQIESGFRPIFRREDIVRSEDDSLEYVDMVSGSIPNLSISRRSDIVYDGSENEYLMKKAELAFEPVFLPSPRDSAFPSTSNGSSDPMVAEASEKQDIFYLPPNPLPSQNNFVKLSSKTQKFIRDTPQFLPFSGELPSDLTLQLSSEQNEVPQKSLILSTKLAVQTNDGKNN